MIEVPSLRELMEAGAHFGHKKERSFPKAKQFVYLVKDQIHVINLEKTREMLQVALNFLEKSAEEGKTIMFLGTKKQAQEIIAKTGEKLGMPYVNYRWLGGMLTNFDTIRGRLKTLSDLESKLQGPDADKLTKKERANLQEEVDKLHKVFDGVKDMKRIPDVLFIADVVKEKNAVMEAKKMGLKIVAITDTNANPQMIDFPIPANDDARKSVEMIVNLIGEAVAEGQKKNLVNRKVQETKEAKA
jgi:small subunit ribosomal protein S2